MQVVLTLAVAEEDLAKEKIKTQLQQKQHEREVHDLRVQLELKAARAEEERKQAVMRRILARMVQRTTAQALDRWVEVVEEATVRRAEEQLQMAALDAIRLSEMSADEEKKRQLEQHWESSRLVIFFGNSVCVCVCVCRVCVVCV